MSDYNEQEKCTDDKCITCSLVEEFGLMIKDGVHWENALRYALGIASDQSEAELADIYTIGFQDGMRHGIEQSQVTLNNLYELIDEEIQNDELEDEIEFDEDDNDDEIQKIIKNNR